MGWLFPLRLQPELDQAADGFGAGRLVILRGGPSVYSCHRLKRKRLR
jgi:hypothetical protein